MRTPSEVHSFVKDVAYPATKQDLIEKAMDNGAEEDIIAELEKLPEDGVYKSPAELSELFVEDDFA
ncbi:MAG: DUF2795 domain-containing protein [Patescibacteria group bacterium]